MCVREREGIAQGVASVYTETAGAKVRGDFTVVPLPRNRILKKYYIII